MLFRLIEVYIVVFTAQKCNDSIKMHPNVLAWFRLVPERKERWEFEIIWAFLLWNLAYAIIGVK